MTPRVSRKELAALSLSPVEVSALLQVPERRVRKEIEHGLLPSPPRLDFVAAVYLRALDLMAGLEPSVEWRRGLLSSIRSHLAHGPLSAVSDDVELVQGVLRLRLRTLAREVSECLVSFLRWRDSRVDSAPNILDSEPVFRGTSLPVRRVGAALDRGEGTEAILEDSPTISTEDVEFARRFAQAYPRVGRPRESESRPRSPRRRRAIRPQGLVVSADLARRLEIEHRKLEPFLPDMDPGDLLLILENLIRGPGSGRNLFVRELRPGVYVT